MAAKLTFVFILLVQLISGQANKSSNPQKRTAFEKAWDGDSIYDNRFSIKTVPLALVDFYGGSSYRLGIECKIYRNVSFYLEGGGYIQNTAFLSDDVTGSIVKPELRYYLNKKRFTNGLFIAVEYIYKQQSYSWADSVFLTPHYLKRFHVSKYVNCISIKFGQTKILYKRLIFESFAGIGIRFKSASVTGISSQEYNAIDDDGSLSDGAERMYGHSILPNITAGIKIGFRIK